MTHHRLLPFTVVAAIVAFVAAYTLVSDVNAQASAKPTPHLADGRPDLNGTWEHGAGISFVRTQRLPDGSVCVIDCPQEQSAPRRNFPGAGDRGTNFPKYKPEFLAKVKSLSDRQVQTDTLLQCQAPGVPRIGPPHKIIQNAREVVFLYDDVNGAFFRIIPTDARPHRKDVPSSYLVDAVGRWVGDTLVVETVNFNEDTWLIDNGAFHTKDLRVVERLCRVGDTLEWQATAYDPAVLTQPWTVRTRTIRLTAHE